MKEKITIKKILDAIREIQSSQPRNKIKKYSWGQIETDYRGLSVRIKFNKDVLEELRRIWRLNWRPMDRQINITEFLGIKVVNKIKV